MDEAVAQRKIANRLKRAGGQLGAVIAALESGADYPTTVTQLSAVSGAISRARFAVISSAMRQCLTDRDPQGPGEGAISLEELEKLFIKLS